MKATGRIVEAKWVQVFTLRDGRLSRYREYSELPHGTPATVQPLPEIWRDLVLEPASRPPGAIPHTQTAWALRDQSRDAW